MKEKIIKGILLGLSIILLIITILLVRVLIKFKNTNDILLKQDLTCQYREEMYVKDFIQKLNGTLLTTDKIDTNKIGNKVIHLEYYNQYGYIARKEFILEIKDKTPPTIVVNNPYIIEKDSIENLKDNIFCADDYDDNISCDIEGTYDLSQIGNYSLKITATDFSNNQTIKKFTLKVTEPVKSNSSSTSNKSPSYTNFSDIYKKYKTKNTMIGLDISKWQEEVDFEKIKNQGVEFVMLKIGGQTKINGEFIMDPRFLDNIKNALEQDLKVGVYFYSYAKTELDAINQAKWIIENLKDYNITLPIAFDWENWSKFSTFHIGFRTLNNIAKSFITEVENNGYEGMLYSSKYYLENIWYKDDYTNWLAYYTDKNTYEYDYKMWQLCSDGKIDGIKNYVDINVYYNN